MDLEGVATSVLDLGEPFSGLLSHFWHWWPPGSNVVLTWFQHGSNMVPTWFQRVYRIVGPQVAEVAREVMATMAAATATWPLRDNLIT